MKRNPISPKRLEFLTDFLRKKLEKAGESSRFSLLEPKLKHLGISDPSSSGEYCSWILNLLLKKDIDLPEDSGKLLELLETFHKVKRRLPEEFRNINRFSSYSQLRITLLPMLPTLKSISELEQEGSQLIATLPLGEAIYQIYQLTTPEAASAAAKNSGWCVCNKETAAGYLEDGPLFLITRNDSRFALAHNESHQVMDINDISISTNDAEHHYAEVQELLSKFLPQFLCTKHPGPNPTDIVDLSCENCDAYGCLGCKHQVCNVDPAECRIETCPKHSSKCVECGNAMCSEHTLDCCRGQRREPPKCINCAMLCSHCNSRICDNCSVHLECCGESVCENHHFGTCESCGGSFCETHADFETCNACNSSACSACREDWIHCDSCGSTTCDDCSDKCAICSKLMCNNCELQCDGCGDTVCHHCTTFCKPCQESFCDECKHHECAGIAHYGDSFHGEAFLCGVATHVPAEEVDVDQLEIEEFCSKCIAPCFKCGVDMCEACEEVCECPQQHRMCPKCNADNVCTVCGETTCYPQQHISCAYVRKQLRRR